MGLAARQVGNVSFIWKPRAQFQLSQFEEMNSSLDENGAPHSGQPVVLSWPSLAQPSQDIPAIRRIEVCYTSRGVIRDRALSAWAVELYQ